MKKITLISLLENLLMQMLKNRKISGVIDISYDSNSETFLEELMIMFLRQEFNQYIKEHNLGCSFF